MRIAATALAAAIDRTHLVDNVWFPVRDGEPQATPKQVRYALDLLERHWGELLHDRFPKLNASLVWRRHSPQQRRPRTPSDAFWP